MTASRYDAGHNKDDNAKPVLKKGELLIEVLTIVKL